MLTLVEKQLREEEAITLKDTQQERPWFFFRKICPGSMKQKTELLAMMTIVAFQEKQGILSA